MNVVQFKNVTFSYDKSITLDDVSFTIDEGDFIAVVGPNGGGKSTLLKLILNQIKAVSGEVTLFGKKGNASLNKIGYVPQFITHQQDFPLKLIDMVLQSKLRSNSLFFKYSKEDVKKAEELLEQLKISQFENRFLQELSGGQRQRALIARALLDDPELLILDEPTASVDISVEQDIYELLHTLNKKMTIVLVTHDVNFVSKYVNRIFCVNRKMNSHKIDEVCSDSNSDSEMYDEPMKHIKHQCGL